MFMALGGPIAFAAYLDSRAERYCGKGGVLGGTRWCVVCSQEI
jgi:hypothetical protein